MSYHKVLEKVHATGNTSQDVLYMLFKMLLKELMAFYNIRG